MSAADGELEGQIDPFETREVLRWIERESSKQKGRVNWQPLRDWLDRLRIPENDMHAPLFSGLSAVVAGIKSGEFGQKDEEGHAKLGDISIEAADYLYEHVGRLERGPQAR